MQWQFRETTRQDWRQSCILAQNGKIGPVSANHSNAASQVTTQRTQATSAHKSAIQTPYNPWYCDCTITICKLVLLGVPVYVKDACTCLSVSCKCIACPLKLQSSYELYSETVYFSVHGNKSLCRCLQQHPLGVSNCGKMAKQLRSQSFKPPPP